MRIWMMAALSVLLAACGAKSNHTVTSPDGDIVLTLLQAKDGSAMYQINRQGQPVLLPSPLGLKLNTGDFTRELNITAAGKPDRKSTRLNSSHVRISYAVFCLKKKTT